VNSVGYFPSQYYASLFQVSPVSSRFYWYNESLTNGALTLRPAKEIVLRQRHFFTKVSNAVAKNREEPFELILCFKGKNVTSTAVWKSIPTVLVRER